jgi:hypothetical protein
MQPAKPKIRQSKTKRNRDAAVRLSEGLSPERLLFLDEIRARVMSGFYNTEPVIDDLSHSFTKAVDALV